jgi:hypothetical protein
MKSISDINTDTPEGKLLMAALAKLTTESQTDKEPDTVLQQCIDLAKHMYKDSEYPAKEETFIEELRVLINKRSIENGSDTPDFILAEYLSDSLSAYQKAVKARDKFFGVDMWHTGKLKEVERV